MQKNPCRVDDPLQNPIDRESYEDAVSLEDGIYPITTDDSTIISSDMVKHGSGTVEDALDELQDDIIFANDTTKYNLPAVGASIDVTKTVTPPTGYSLVGIINTSSGTSSTACMPFIFSDNPMITVLNVANSGQVGTQRTLTWTNIFKKL